MIFDYFHSGLGAASHVLSPTCLCYLFTFSFQLFFFPSSTALWIRFRTEIRYIHLKERWGWHHSQTVLFTTSTHNPLTTLFFASPKHNHRSFNVFRCQQYTRRKSCVNNFVHFFRTQPVNSALRSCLITRAKILLQPIVGQKTLYFSHTNR